jgi:hypothetical protein
MTTTSPHFSPFHANAKENSRLEKLIVSRLVKKLSAFYRTRNLISMFSRTRPTGSYTEPDEFCVIFKNHFNVILLSTRSSPIHLTFCRCIWTSLPTNSYRLCVMCLSFERQSTISLPYIGCARKSNSFWNLKSSLPATRRFHTDSYRAQRSLEFSWHGNISFCVNNFFHFALKRHFISRTVRCFWCTPYEYGVRFLFPDNTQAGVCSATVMCLQFSRPWNTMESLNM